MYTIYNGLNTKFLQENMTIYKQKWKQNDCHILADLKFAISMSLFSEALIFRDRI